MIRPNTLADDTAIDRPRGRRRTQRTPARTGSALEPRDRSRRARALARELSGSAARARLRLGILRHLDRHGPCAPTEIPTGWPVTRDHVRGMLRWLAEYGLVERGRDPLYGYPQVRLTHTGRRVLEEIDWDRAIAAP